MLPISCVQLKAEACDGMNTESELERKDVSLRLQKCYSVSVGIHSDSIKYATFWRWAWGSGPKMVTVWVIAVNPKWCVSSFPYK